MNVGTRRKNVYEYSVVGYYVNGLIFTTLLYYLLCSLPNVYKYTVPTVLEYVHHYIIIIN